MNRFSFSPSIFFICLLVIGFSSLLKAEESYEKSKNLVPEPTLLNDAENPNLELIDVHQAVLQNTTLSSIIQEVNAQNFTSKQRQSILYNAIRVIEGMNPHLFIRNRFLKVNPVSSMRTFATYANSVSNFEFHVKMRTIFNSMNDGHTVYIPPKSMVDTVVTLGFYIESYFKTPGGPRIYIFAGTFRTVKFQHPSLKTGAQILTIDGEAVDQMAARLGALSPRANKASQLQSGTFLLTTRRPAFYPLPSKKAATIRYISSDGKRLHLDVPWNYYRSVTSTPSPNMTDGFQPSLPGADFLLTRQPEHDVDSNVLQSRRKQDDIKKHFLVRQEKDLVPDFLKDHYEAAELLKDDERFGYLGVKDFAAPLTKKFQKGLAKIVRALPQNGLILDVRDNPGGYAYNVVYLFELLSSQLLRPMPQVIRSTRLTLEMTEKTNDSFLRALQPATNDAVMFGEPFSGPSGNLLSDFLNETRSRLVDRAYNGPIVTLANAASASGGDLIVSFSRDYNMSYVINVDGTTAGAGATVLSYEGLQRLVPEIFTETFPFGISFTSAFIRLYRALRQSGALIEYKGVEPDERYYYTKNDVLNYSIDLIQYSLSKLKMMN